MISVVIPALDAEATLAATLTALVPAAVDGLVREVVVADGGSTDRTLDIADQCGAEIARSARGRGQQLLAGAARARHSWLLFLHADTVLQPGWAREAWAFIESVESGARTPAGAAFRFALDDTGLAPRVLEGLVGLRCAALRWPYGDQGMLISRRLYDEIGGYRPLPLMEDIDFARRLGRNRLVMLPTRAVTSALRYRSEGYVRRTLRNQACLAMFFFRAPMASILRVYGTGAPEAPAVTSIGSPPAE